MKLLNFSILSAVVLAAVSGVHSAPADTAPTVDPATQKQIAAADRLDNLRDQLQTYETPIVHAYLARAALNGSVENEASLVEKLFKQEDGDFAQPDPITGDWIKKKFLKGFNDVPYPTGVKFDLPVVLDKDAVLDKPVTGKGIFPVGRRPQDPVNVVDFVQKNLGGLPVVKTLDPAAVANLDVALYHLISARVLIGYEIGLAKFESQPDAACDILTGKGTDEEKHAQLVKFLTYEKQQVDVLGRIKDKAKGYTKLFWQDQPYPPHVAKDVLRLFQAYLVPVTTEIEAAAVFQQKSFCQPVGGKGSVHHVA